MTQVASNAHRVEVIAGGGNQVQALAQTMGSNTFAEVTGMGGAWSNGTLFFIPQVGGYISQYSVDLEWDAARQKFWFIGASHIQQLTFNYTRFLEFDHATHSWFQLCGESGSESTCPNFGVIPSGWGHTYSHLAFNNKNNRMYCRRYGSHTVGVWNAATRLWEASQEKAPVGTPKQDAGAMTYFPERNCLVFVDGDWGVWELRFGSDTGTIFTPVQIATTNVGGQCPMQAYNNLCQYNRTHQCVVFGGGAGDGRAYRLNLDGTITNLGTAPIGIGSHAGSGSTGALLKEMPGSGDFLLVGESGVFVPTQWRWNPTTNVWTQMAVAFPWSVNTVDGPSFGTIGCTVHEYGVIAYLKFVGAGASPMTQMWLYKP